MRDLILKMSISIDGFVAGPENECDWPVRYPDAGAKEWTLACVRNAGVHIMGSHTFAEMAAYWPQSTHMFAPAMNEIPKVVFGRATATGTNTSWEHARVATGPLADEIDRLKREEGEPIIAHGGAAFAQSLVRGNLVDEYRLLVHPVALGRGKALFSTLDARRELALVDLQRFDSGSIAMVYRRR